MNSDIQNHLASIAKGDVDAMEEIYNSLSVRVFNYARVITKSKEMSEDITHDVFMQILEKAVRIADTADPIAYIMVITRNQSYDYLKNNCRSAELHESIYEESAASFAYESMFVWDALSRLPADQQEAVYLHYIAGFTYKETAKITGSSLITTKRKSAKALSQLRDYFNQHEEENCNEYCEDIARYNNQKTS